MSVGRHPDANGNLTLTLPGWNSGGTAFRDPQRHRDYGGPLSPEGAPSFLGGSEPDAGELTTLISLSSLGMDVELAFYYNSHSTENSGYGYRRTCNLNLRAFSRGSRLTTGACVGAYSSVTITRGNGARVTYSYDGWSDSFVGGDGHNRLQVDVENGLLLEITPDGRVMAFDADTANEGAPILWAQDAFGHRHTFEYNDKGHLISLEDAVGRHVTFQRDKEGVLKSLTDWASRTVSFEYDTQACPCKPLLKKVKGADGGTEVAYGYDKHGRVTKVTDAEGFVTQYTLSPGGRVLERDAGSLHGVALLTTYAYTDGQTVVTDALEQITTFDVGGNGIIRVANALGTRATFTYDSAGRETSRTNAGGNTWWTTLGSRGLPTGIRDGANRSTSFIRDEWGNVVQMTTHDNAITQMVYTDSDNPTGEKKLLRASTNALSHTTSYSYNALGLLVSETDPLNHTTTWEYDSFGRQTKVTNALQHSTGTTYDAAGNVLSTTDPENYTWTSTYDKGDRVKTTTDPFPATTRFEYDRLGHLVKTTNALNGTRTYTYNVFGLLETETDEIHRVTVNNEYDALGRLFAITDAAQHRTETYYDVAGRVVRTIEAAGEVGFELTTLTEYDELDRVVAVTDPTLRRTTYQSSITGEVTGQTDAGGVSTTNQYDSMGRLTGTFNALGQGAQSRYDALGRVYETLDAKGHVTQMKYDEANRLVKNIDPLLNETNYEYNAANYQTAIINALGHRSETQYDKRGLPILQTDPLLHKVRTQYDGLGRAIATFDHFNQRISRTQYDALGRHVGTYDALEHGTTYEYDPVSRMVASIDAENHRTTYDYDELDRQTAVINSLGYRHETHYDVVGRVDYTIEAAGVLNIRTSTVYDKSGRILEEHDALNHITCYEYDDGGRLKATILPNGQRTAPIYDSAGRAVGYVDPKGKTTTFVLDANGSQTATVDPLGQTVGTHYDELGRPKISVNNALERTETIYNEIGQVVGIKDALGYVTTLRYDDAGRQVAVVDAKNHRTTFVYNERNQLVEEHDPLGHVTSHLYDLAGRRTETTDAKGQTTHWTYDGLDRVTNVTFADGTSIINTFDAGGRQTAMQDGTGTTIYTFDAAGRELSVEYGSGHTIHYLPDANGNRVQMTDPDNGVTSYQYDESGRLLQLTNPLGETTRFHYDSLDRVDVKTLANGVVEKHVFDDSGRETLIEYRDSADLLLASFESLYEASGRRHSVTEADGSVISYGYDAAGQLLNETRTGTNAYTIDYTYDEVGNRHTKTESALVTTYTYDDANQLLREETRDTDGNIVSQGTSDYDWNGNVTHQVEDGQLTTFEWNSQNFLMAVTHPNGSNDSYTYCGEGIRRTKTGSDGFRRFIRDGQNILLEAANSGGTLRRYTHEGDDWGTLLSMHQGNDSRFYGFDGSANTRVMIDQSGDVTDSYLYSAFGEERQVIGNSSNPLRFGGEVGYYRDEMNRLYVRARHLDVHAGRWLSRDPIGFAGGDYNLYRYVGSSPTNYKDPSGLVALVDDLVEAGLITLAMAAYLTYKYYTNKAEYDRDINIILSAASRTWSPSSPPTYPTPPVRANRRPRTYPRYRVPNSAPFPAHRKLPRFVPNIGDKTDPKVRDRVEPTIRQDEEKRKKCRKQEFTPPGQGRNTSKKCWMCWYTCEGGMAGGGGRIIRYQAPYCLPAAAISGYIPGFTQPHNCDIAVAKGIDPWKLINPDVSPNYVP